MRNRQYGKRTEKIPPVKSTGLQLVFHEHFLFVFLILDFPEHRGNHRGGMLQDSDITIRKDLVFFSGSHKVSNGLSTDYHGFHIEGLSLVQCKQIWLRKTRSQYNRRIDLLIHWPNGWKSRIVLVDQQSRNVWVLFYHQYSIQFQHVPHVVKRREESALPQFLKFLEFLCEFIHER